MEQLEKIVSKIKDVTGIDIRDKSRKQEIVFAKKIYCHIARQKGYIFKTIGDHVGINHATVIWHCNDAENLFSQDKMFYNNYLRVQGKPTEVKCSRDYFDLAIAQHEKRQLTV